MVFTPITLALGGGAEILSGALARVPLPILPAIPFAAAFVSCSLFPPQSPAPPGVLAWLDGLS